MNGVAYFGADDGIHGRGLWRSDGTNSGTYQLKESVKPLGIIACNDKVFFSTVGSTSLWVSDGTVEDTDTLFTPQPSVISNPNPLGLINFNGTAFFTISNQSNNDQLWKSDGTPAGTVLVKDFYDPVSLSGRLANFSVVKNKLYFSVESYLPITRSHLWVTNGEAGGTYLMSDKVFDPAQIISSSSDPLDELAYFSATSSQYGQRTLFVTNGNQGVANAVNGFNGIISNDNNIPIIKQGNIIYFLGRENASSQHQSLYKFDVNTINGIQPVKTVTGTGNGGAVSRIDDLFELGGKLIFPLFDAVINKHQLWMSDGSSSGNVILNDSLQSFNFAKADGLLFFTGVSALSGLELWKTDGTVSGTGIVKDINTGINSSSPNSLTYINNGILFTASDSVHGAELWQSDGTSAGTSLVKDINQNATAPAYPYGLTAFNNNIFFLAYETAGNIRKLWKSDGTNSGTVVINDTIYHSGFQDALIIHNNESYFWGTSLSGKLGLYKSNGTAAGTVLVKDLTGMVLYLQGIVKTDNLVYFYFQNSITSRFELWRTDGTNANTYIVKNEFTGSTFNAFVSTGENLFFSTYNNNNNSQRLWKTDGTVAGTVLLSNLVLPNELFAHKGVLYFSGFYQGQTTLWKSDGTPTGTLEVTAAVSSPSNFISSNGELFFTASTNTGINIGNELYKTDGTKNGTVLVKDITPGTDGTIVFSKISLNGILYLFTNSPGSNYKAIWKTDGSNEGTQFVSYVGNGTGGSLSKIVTGNGRIFFVLDGSIWESDGTQNGTHAISDIGLSGLTLYDYNADLTVVGNQLFFTGSNYNYGLELYVGNINTAAIAEYTTAANGNWNDPATWVGNAVPPPGVNVRILHNVIANMNATCNDLRVEAPGGLIVNDGIRITLFH